MEKSSKVITFMDVGGSEKYTRTLVQGFGIHPDYALIVIDAL
jgi:GTPase